MWSVSARGKESANAAHRVNMPAFAEEAFASRCCACVQLACEADQMRSPFFGIRYPISLWKAAGVQWQHP